MPLLADVRLTGIENFPKRGPLIVVGNHTAVMEVVLMTIYTPWIVEFMGSIDIPHENFISTVVNAYGFIPVFRGNVSRASLQAGLDVLKQGGILGVFPEGGIWEPSIRRAQSGVAWLSYHSQAPILPIGFGSMQGGLNKMFSFKHPRLKMNVGQVLPAVDLPPGKFHKAHFQEVANQIMDAVWNLIPEEDRQQEQAIRDERFELQIQALDENGKDISIPENLIPRHGEALSKFIHRKTLISNFQVNLGIPVEALMNLADQADMRPVAASASAIMEHLERDNPYYFTYRYGQREGRAMQDGIRELLRLARWAIEAGIRLKITPVRRFFDLAADREITLDHPQDFNKL